MAKKPEPPPALRVSLSAGEDENEDHAISLQQDGICLIAAFDGCGGVGGRRYPQLNNRTGANIASALYADCLKEWFRANARSLPRANTAGDLNALFSQAAREYNVRYLSLEASVVTGSMVRTLPSTAAAALLYPKEAALYWAGDTRGYLLADAGLKQLTEDDLATPCDAFDSLYRDAPICNYLCADLPFALHEKTVQLPPRGMLVLATDGAYHTQPTPMHFEAMILDTIYRSSSVKQWKKMLREQLKPSAADDVTLVLQPFGFLSLEELKAFYDGRRRHVRQAYIVPADQAASGGRMALKSLWEMYRRE